MSASMFLKTPEGVSLAPGDGGGLVFQGPWCRLAIREADPGPFAALAATGGYEDVLARTALRSSGPAGMARFYYYLGRLVERGFVVRSACLDGRLLASLVPVSPAFRLAAARAAPAHRLALSRFAFIRRHEARACLESPRAHARVVLYDRRVAELVQALMEQPRAEGADDEPLCGLPSEAAEATLDLLWSAGMLTELDVNGAPAEDADPALRCWEFHDLLFHARSRMGRTDLRYGATYALAGVVAPPPALKPVSVAEAVPLERPDLARLEREDPPLAWAMEHRCSVREYAAEPMTAGQLGEFLFRVARVREVISHEILTPAGPMTMDIAPRPYPAGGALYELEVYAVVQACAGVGPGIYYYDPCGHRLARLRGPTDEYGLLLEDAALCAGVDPATLQVLLVSSARFPRVSWKYSGLAYSLVLKHVGIVQQSMYLVATSMGLGGCALGAGDSDLFARAVGTDYYAETSVGEFLLGSVPRGRSVPARGLVAGAAEPNGPTDPARPAPW